MLPGTKDPRLNSKLSRSQMRTLCDSRLKGMKGCAAAGAAPGARWPAARACSCRRDCDMDAAGGDVGGPADAARGRGGGTKARDERSDGKNERRDGGDVGNVGEVGCSEIGSAPSAPSASDGPPPPGSALLAT